MRIFQKQAVRGIRLTLCILVASALSCLPSKSTPASTILHVADCDGDGHLEAFYLDMISEDYDRDGKRDYLLSMLPLSGESMARIPQTAYLFRRKPFDLRIIDVNGDRCADLVYIMSTREDKNSDQVFDFGLYRSLNTGRTAHFEDPLILQTFCYRPTMTVQ